MKQETVKLNDPNRAKILARLHGTSAPAQHKQGRMNKTEAEYAARLDLVKGNAPRDVCEYYFESIKLRLADRTWYTPDFLVLLNDGTFEVHEVKGGFIRDDALVKFKVAAETYPFIFYLCVKNKAGWKISRYGG